MTKHIIAIFLFVFVSSIAFAQYPSKTKPLSTENKKAEKCFMNAQMYLNVRNYLMAIEELKRAIKADDKFIEAYFTLAETYADNNDYPNAEIYYTEGLKINPNFYNEANYALANIQFLSEKYADAKTNYELFLSRKVLYDDLKTVAEKRLANCNFAIDAMLHPVPFNPINMGTEINTADDEYFPTTTVDDQTLLFTRAEKDEKSPAGINENFYVSTRLDGKWSNAIPIGPPINTIFNEGAPTLSPDGQTLVFTACEIYDQYGPGRDGFGSCDLFFTFKNGKNWDRPMNLSVPINTSNWESQPSLSSDGRTMYFIRGVKQGRVTKDQDIWVTTLSENKTWKAPIRLPYPINTPGIEESVFIHPDGRTLYFASDGHPGMGSTDIYMSRIDSAGNWSTPINLGYPINTGKRENSVLVSGDGKTAYFASNRAGGMGGQDIYSFELPEAVRPIATSYMKGKVYDEETKAPLAADFDLIDLKTGKVIVHSTSNKGNGEFLVALPTGNDYALNVSKKGYLFYSDNFSFKGIFTKTNPDIRDIPLKPIKAGVSIVLKNIFFDIDKFELKKESMVELTRLIDLLKKNPLMKIEIGGHTDSQSDDTYNLKLSENRAKSVLDYLVTNGIAFERLTYKGYGETMPIGSNDTDAGRALNRRTEFKVISNN